LTLLKLRAFRAVVERESLTAAAHALFVTEPVVNAHVRSLEAVFGTRLLARQGRRMVPTLAGQALFNYACVVTEATQQVAEEIGSYRSARRGQLRICASSPGGSAALSQLAIAFLKEYPAVDLALHLADQATMENATLNGLYDFSLMSRVDVPAALEFEPLGRDELILVLAPEHPWARRGRIAVSELTEAVFVAPAPGTPRRLVEDQWLAYRRIRRRVRFAVGDAEAAKQGVLAGLGVCFALRGGVARELAHGTLVTVALADDAWPWVETGLIHRRNVYLTPLQQAFLTHCRAMAVSGQLPFATPGGHRLA
jgi:DNA-binding transcriptional LysR family regulator